MRLAGIAFMVLVFVLQAVAAQAKSLGARSCCPRGRALQLPLEVSREEFGIVRSGSSPTAIAPQRFFGNKSGVLRRTSQKHRPPGFWGPASNSPII